ncbi:hypothetical protein [Nostoc sp.]|uniref:hypothetical protein n=1 Tax=Nostoc sp. TaxID=1180 RepID=UPI002FF580E3
MSKTGIDSNADIASAVVVTTLKGAVGCDRYKGSEGTAPRRHHFLSRIYKL